MLLQKNILGDILFHWNLSEISIGFLKFAKASKRCFANNVGVDADVTEAFRAMKEWNPKGPLVSNFFLGSVV